MWKICCRGQLVTRLEPVLFEQQLPAATMLSSSTASTGLSRTICGSRGENRTGGWHCGRLTVAPRFRLAGATSSSHIHPRLLEQRGHVSLLLRDFSLSSHQLGDRKEDAPDDKQLTLGQKFKKMFKDYWYVLVPVHLVTSVVWFGSFYLVAKSGVDIVSMLQALSVPEYYLDKIRSSEAGYYALAYACYKIATPVRYTVTIGGTTFTVAKLKEAGYLRTTREVADKMKDKKEDLKERYEETRDKVREEWETAWEKWAKRKH